MLQKYVISRDMANNQLKIREYAIIHKNLKKDTPTIQNSEDYQLLCEETYESEMIKRSISEGMKALISSLRSDKIFPIEPYAVKIAESVATLYDTSEDGKMELYFNDHDLISN